MGAHHEAAEPGASAEGPQQSVIASLELSDDEWGEPGDFAELDALEERLMQAIEESGAGEFDGIGRGMGFLDVYAYGPSADALLEVVMPVIRSFVAQPGSYIVKRYGEPGAPEVRIDL